MRLSTSLNPDQACIQTVMLGLILIQTVDKAYQ